MPCAYFALTDGIDQPPATVYAVPSVLGVYLRTRLFKLSMTNTVPSGATVTP